MPSSGYTKITFFAINDSSILLQQSLLQWAKKKAKEKGRKIAISCKVQLQGNVTERGCYLVPGSPETEEAPGFTRSTIQAVAFLADSILAANNTCDTAGPCGAVEVGKNEPVAINTNLVVHKDKYQRMNHQEMGGQTTALAGPSKRHKHMATATTIIPKEDTIMKRVKAAHGKAWSSLSVSNKSHLVKRLVLACATLTDEEAYKTTIAHTMASVVATARPGLITLPQPTTVGAGAYSPPSKHGVVAKHLSRRRQSPLASQPTMMVTKRMMAVAAGFSTPNANDAGANLTPRAVKRKRESSGTHSNQMKTGSRTAVDTIHSTRPANVFVAQRQRPQQKPSAMYLPEAKKHSVQQPKEAGSMYLEKKNTRSGHQHSQQFVPANTGEKASLEQPSRPWKCNAVALYDFAGDIGHRQLSVKKDQKLQIVRNNGAQTGWVLRKASDGQRGHVPTSYVYTVEETGKGTRRERRSEEGERDMRDGHRGREDRQDTHDINNSKKETERMTSHRTAPAKKAEMQMEQAGASETCDPAVVTDFSVRIENGNTRCRLMHEAQSLACLISSAFSGFGHCVTSVTVPNTQSGKRECKFGRSCARTECEYLHPAGQVTMEPHAIVRYTNSADANAMWESMARPDNSKQDSIQITLDGGEW
jgi:hypothetical protein